MAAGLSPFQRPSLLSGSRRRSFDQDRVADLNTQSRDLVFVVQRRTRYGDARDRNGPKTGDRSERAVRPTCTSIFSSTVGLDAPDT